MGRNLTGGSAVASPSSGSSSSSSSSSSDDPRKEGLPCIATWTMQDDNARRYNCVVYDSNGGQMGAPFSQSSYSSPSDYYGGQIADKYWGYSGDAGHIWRTNGQLSSGNSTYMVGSTTYASHLPVHACMNVSPMGMFSSTRHASGNSVMRVIQEMCTQVLPEGIRPRCTLTRYNQTFYRAGVLISSRTQGHPGSEAISIWDDADLVAKFGQDNMSPKNLSNGGSMDTGRGACGYNERTKTFVILWKKSNDNTSRITRWKFTKNLNDLTIPLKEVFLSATSVETMPSTFTIGWSGTQEADRMMVTVGDNDKIRMTQFRESNAVRTWLINDDLSQGTGYNATQGQYYHNNTTSYGMEQGWRHIGVTYNSTWDNKWHIHYSHYYYYGCGISAFITSTEDPELVYKMSYSDSSGGCPVHAWGKTGFIFNRASNSDSEDHRLFNLDFKEMKTTKAAYDAEAGKYYSYQYFDQPSIGSNISINDYAQLWPAHGYQSTNYPTYLTVNWWPTKDGKMYYGGQY